jgi:hypothetical protein
MTCSSDLWQQGMGRLNLHCPQALPHTTLKHLQHAAVYCCTYS